MFVWTCSIKRQSLNRIFSGNPVTYTVRTIFPFGRVARNAWTSPAFSKGKVRSTCTLSLPASTRRASSSNP